MRLISVAALIAAVCIAGTAFAAPDEEPGAEKAPASNVSIQLMDYGEGADRTIRLTLSDKWSNLPESSKKHVLAKLRDVLPEASLKQALLALARGETEVLVSATAMAVPAFPTVPARRIEPPEAVPGTPKAHSIPATPLIPLKRLASVEADDAPAEKVEKVEKVVILRKATPSGGDGLAIEGMHGGTVELRVLGPDDEDEAFENLPEEARKKFREAMKKQIAAGGQPRVFFAGPGRAVRMKTIVIEEDEDEDEAWEDDDDRDEGSCFSCGKGVRDEVRVVVSGDGNWKELPPEVRNQILQSLRSSLPQDELAEILRALSQGGPQGRRFAVQAPGQPGCGCGGRKTPPAPQFRFEGRGPGGCGQGGRGGRPAAPQGRCGSDAGRCGCGGRRGGQGGPDQGALVRALMALTHEVQALRQEVASLRGAHGQAAPPPRRMMLGVAPGQPRAGVMFVKPKCEKCGDGECRCAPNPKVAKPGCQKCEGECKCAPKASTPQKHVVRIVTGEDGRLEMSGGVAVTGANPRPPAVEKDMESMKQELTEIRMALRKLMGDLQKLQQAQNNLKEQGK